MLPRFKIQYPMKNQYKITLNFINMQYHECGIFLICWGIVLEFF
jgi:hypothetical protein